MLNFKKFKTQPFSVRRSNLHCDNNLILTFKKVRNDRTQDEKNSSDRYEVSIDRYLLSFC